MRKRILEKCCRYKEIGNSFWELEDDCTLKDGVDIDILYRNIEDFSQIICFVVEEHTAYLPSYDTQIRKAIARKDAVSVNHRTAAFLESYVDIIVALNKLTHPGEKRMVQYAAEKAEILPDNFEDNLKKLLENLFTNSDKAVQIFEEMTAALEKVIKCSDMS